MLVPTPRIWARGRHGLCSPCDRARAGAVFVWRRCDQACAVFFVRSSACGVASDLVSVDSCDRARARWRRGFPGTVREVWVLLASTCVLSCARVLCVAIVGTMSLLPIGSSRRSRSSRRAAEDALADGSRPSRHATEDMLADHDEDVYSGRAGTHAAGTGVDGGGVPWCPRGQPAECGDSVVCVSCSLQFSTHKYFATRLASMVVG